MLYDSKGGVSLLFEYFILATFRSKAASMLLYVH